MKGRFALRIAGAVLLALVLVGVATYVAGEQTEVAVLRSFDPDGTPHDTKLWVVDHEGAPWVRVANPGREWFHRLAANPRAELVRGERVQVVVATAHDSAEVRAALDQSFREKYGVTDWWYGLLLRRDAIPVRLDPVPGP
jgi:hypothetical protein